MVRLLTRPLSSPSPLSSAVFLCIAGQAYWRERGRGEGGRGAKSCDGEKAWSSINHSILCALNTPSYILSFTVPLVCHSPTHVTILLLSLCTPVTLLLLSLPNPVSLLFLSLSYSFHSVLLSLSFSFHSLILFLSYSCHSPTPFTLM
jgi:hypothetical protein